VQPLRAYFDIETTGLDPDAGELTVVGIHFEQDGQERMVQLYEDALTKTNSGHFLFSDPIRRDLSRTGPEGYRDYRRRWPFCVIRSVSMAWEG
jgi:hypothetical protein